MIPSTVPSKETTARPDSRLIVKHWPPSWPPTAAPHVPSAPTFSVSRPPRLVNPPPLPPTTPLTVCATTEGFVKGWHVPPAVLSPPEFGQGLLCEVADLRHHNDLLEQRVAHHESLYV